MRIFYSLIVFIFGLAIGSFLNVCIYRIPRKESIISPGSHCPHCRHPLGLWDLIPLISIIILRGKCRYCGKEISPRYFFVELTTAVLFLALYVRFMVYERSPVLFFSYLLLSSALIAITFIDLEHKIIPDRITYPGIAAGLLFSIFIGNFWVSLLGLFIGAGVLYFIIIVSHGGMGGGDVKLAGMLGSFLGWRLLLLTLFLSFLSGGIVAIILLLLKLKGRKDYIPFGPYLAIAGIVAIFWGQQILSWYGF